VLKLLEWGVREDWHDFSCFVFVFPAGWLIKKGCVPFHQPRYGTCSSDHFLPCLAMFHVQIFGVGSLLPEIGKIPVSNRGKSFTRVRTQLCLVN
jgi:hypothetical protein